MKYMVTNRFVKSEDLNHHGTLFAGRGAEWFIESGLMAVSQYLPSENIVCLKLHEMKFGKPIRLGEIAEFTSAVVYAGRTSVIVNTTVRVNGEEIISGWVTYINVDGSGRPIPHGLVIEAGTEEEKELQAKAKDVTKH
ncbi:MAG: acyl-CoA thioesterase [Eubacterium sp.]|nr:acyl-CoA thioesterase [Eubacterium sp.]